MKLSHFCINRPVFATVINLLIILAGIISYRALTVREFPNVTTPIVNIETQYPGASAEIIENEVTRPLEDTLSGISGVDYISSISRDEVSAITIVFKPNRDIDAATNDIRDNVDRVKAVLPQDTKEPLIAKVAADAEAIIWLAISSKNHSLMEISEYTEQYIKDRLEILPGVANIIMVGERKPAMRISLNPYRLAAYSLTVKEIADALRHQNIAMPSGRLESNSKEFVVYSKTDLETENEFKNIILRDEGGYLLRLGDVANVELAPANERFIARYNSQPILALGIVKQSTANPLDISNALKETLPAIKSGLPQGMQIDIGYDSTVVIKESIEAVFKTILEAIILVVLIIYLFLREPRATLIPIVTIPIALIGGFALMLIWGFSINILTLLAMVLAIGLVVDDAIVVLENIYRHIENGEKPLEAAKKGISEVGSAVVAMTLTLVSVFAPIAFAEGKIGKLFTEFAVVLAGTVVLSGFTALTLTPMMCSKLLKPHVAKGAFFQAIENMLERTTERYRLLLIKALQYRNWILGGLVLILGLNLIMFMSLKSEMTPTEDRGFIIAMGLAPEGSTIDYTTHYAMKMEPILSQVKEINSHFLIVGWPNVQQAISFSLLTPWEKRKLSQQSLVENLNMQLFSNPGLMTFAINPPSSLEQDVLAGQIGLVVQFPGTYSELQNIIERILAKARAYPGLQNVDSDLKLSKPQVQLVVNRDKAAQGGVDVDTIGENLQILLGGQEITKFTRHAKKYDVIVQADKEMRQNPTDIGSVLVRAKDGTMFPLSSFITGKEITTASTLNHFNKLPAVTISASLTPGYSLGEVLQHLENIAKEVAADKIQIDYSGASRAFKQTSGALYITFALALVVVFLVLAAQFESFLNPFIIMFSVPLAVAGALLTLILTGGTLNIFSQIGLITLVGLITKHGILIVEFSNSLYKQGKSLQEAILEATTLRLRPILMTTAAMVLGALPLAFATGAGAESRQEIGWVIVGGMTLGTFLTLFIVPVVYYFLAAILETKMRARRNFILEPV